MMNPKDQKELIDVLKIMLGCMITEAGGEFQISPESVNQFMTNITNKEVLFMDDPATRIITVKIEEKPVEVTVTREEENHLK